MRIKIKPLSVNGAWAGRRFKTPAYKAFEEEFCLKIKKEEVPKGRLFVRLQFGFSNKASDIDNGVKPTLDCLQKKLGFNDKNIYLMEVEKDIVPKGSEYIDYEISALD